MRLLMVSFGPEGLTYVRKARQQGMTVRVLDCVERHHRKLMKWYGDAVLHVQGHRADVRSVVANEHFDVALVHEEQDFVRTALITQSLREAGVPNIIVVTRDESRRAMYRRCGAHRVVTGSAEERVWECLSRVAGSFATA
ncbi:MAG: hypothetical protein K6T83_23030 [Alicyclobacillus sp.]|nr:hypothetical protein [Alicyclobacillus sp.]